MKKQRVGPKGVSSGVSLRRFPDPSLQAIIDICDHYEAKCSGKYVSLASRYVFHMSKEIRAQIDALKQCSNNNNNNSPSYADNVNEKGKYVRFLSNRSPNRINDVASQGRTAKRQNNFSCLSNSSHHPCKVEDNRESTHSSTEYSFPSSPFCPCGCTLNQLQHVHDRVIKQQETIDELVVALNAAQEELSKLRGSSFTETTEFVDVLRKGAEADRTSHQEILAEVKRQCEERVAIAKMEARNTKERAKQEIQAMQRRTDETMASLVHALQEEKEDAIKETEEIQKRITRDYFYRRGQLDDKIKNVEKNERLAVQRACTRLKRLHALETLASKRDDILSQMKGCEEINLENLKLKDSCSNNLDSDDSESCAKDGLKEEEFTSLQSQVNDLKGWLKSLATALRESNKISQSAALPSKAEAIHAVRKKYKLNPSKPLDESRYVFRHNANFSIGFSLLST